MNVASRSSLIPNPAVMFSAVTLMIGCGVLPAHAQQKIKALPPAGLAVDDAVRQTLTERVDSLHDQFNAAIAKRTTHPDALIAAGTMFRAVDMALKTDGFYRPKDTDDAASLLDRAERHLRRHAQTPTAPAIDGDVAANGSPAWIAADTPDDAPVQLRVGGYRSRIDGSIQPFGVAINRDDLDRLDDPKRPLRLDVWLHGRGDNKTEIAFIKERLSKIGTYAPPPGTVMLHPFGRHCNAFKFAGEVDVFESIDRVCDLFSIDRDRVAIRGFSMGGAGVWHLSVHHPGRWMASNPGAGFVDTLVYQRWGDDPPFELTPTRRSLLNLYDVLPWTRNLSGVPVIAYSGEVDKQRQAAQRVADRVEQINATSPTIDFDHVIGQKMGHKIDEPSKKMVEAKLATLGDRSSRSDRTIDYTTYTTRYPGSRWIRVTGMQKHFTPARVQAKFNEQTIDLETEGVTRMRIDLSSFDAEPIRSLTLRHGGSSYRIDDSDPDRRSFQTHLAIGGDSGSVAVIDGDLGGVKRPGLQGPIDDAFMDAFVFVLPSRPARHGAVQRWIERESKYAATRWRSIMRGDIRTVLDRDVTPEMAANHHLICFGDLDSNRYLNRIADRLPIQWTEDTIKFRGQTHDPATTAVAMIYPNPDAPDRYVVLNSGMSFRDFSNTSNSRQIAMLGDYAVFDVTEPNDDIFAGRILDEGFFDEDWR